MTVCRQASARAKRKAILELRDVTGCNHTEQPPCMVCMDAWMHGWRHAWTYGWTYVAVCMYSTYHECIEPAFAFPSPPPSSHKRRGQKNNLEPRKKARNNREPWKLCQSRTQNVAVETDILKVIISAGVIISYCVIIGLWCENRLSKQYYWEMLFTQLCKH